MSYQLLFHPLAEKEYRKAFLRYELIQKELGDRFEKMVGQRISQIIESPENYHISKGPFREAIVQDFLYSIVFKINKRRKLVFVSSIFHTRQHPRGKYRK